MGMPERILSNKAIVAEENGLIYKPTFTRFKVKDAPTTEYVRRVDYKHTKGHILKDPASYYLVLRDEVPYDDLTGRVVAFSRPTLAEIEALALKIESEIVDGFSRVFLQRKRKVEDNRIRIVKGSVPVDLNDFSTFAGKKLINLRNGKLIEPSDYASYPEFLRKNRLTGAHVMAIYMHGKAYNMLCYYGERVDGLSWPEYFARNPQGGLKRRNYSGVELYRDGKLVYTLGALRDAAAALGLNHQEKLRLALVDRQTRYLDITIVYPRA